MDSVADILIVTVSETESKAVMSAFREAVGAGAQPRLVHGRTYHNLGDINGSRVFMGLSEMGAAGIGASQQSVQKGIAALGPKAVILVGVAFGVNEKEQSIGDILVSQQLWLYELQRVGKELIIPRGDKPHASSFLFDYFRGAGLYWDGAQVRYGLVLTGEKLVDNLDYREQLKAFEPEAIGGEMEGAGLYVACQESGVGWIVVKAICDWADGNKSADKTRRQELAAHNAAAFVLQALLRVPLIAPPSEISGFGIPNRSHHSTLPNQPYFIGRSKELTSIAEAISPEARTWGALIDGPGGVGKTALALRAAHLASSAQFPTKLFLSAKMRELTPAGEQPLQDFMLPNFLALITEVAQELGEANITRVVPEARASAVRRALADKRVLLIIDNVETLGESERVRLYQFLSLLPGSCKAIVTSRRRTDIDARIIRLGRLLREEAMELIEQLARSNRYLREAPIEEREQLYGVTHGNPLLIKWTVGQLGRSGSHCRTISDACEFLKASRSGNDPLEYIFGDLLDTFTEDECAVLASLTHFDQPAKLEWVTKVAGLAQPTAQTALEDLTERALTESDEEQASFALPPLAATFLRRARPISVAVAGDRLCDRALALAQENGYLRFDNFGVLEAEWPTISAAIPLILQRENGLVQTLCDAIAMFLNLSGRWDERMALGTEAEKRAVETLDLDNAGWRAYQAAYIYAERGQFTQANECLDRCDSYWKDKPAGSVEKLNIRNLRAEVYLEEREFDKAAPIVNEGLTIARTMRDPEVLAASLALLGSLEHLTGAYSMAERHFREAIDVIKTEDRAPYWRCVIMAHLSATLLKTGDSSAAEDLAREALSIAEDLGYQNCIGRACRELAKALAGQDRADEALPLAKQAVVIFTALHSNELTRTRATLEELEQQLGGAVS